MATRAIWKGAISFGLVSIPIELYSAVQEHSIGFKLLHRVCNTPISNKRWCTHCNKEVAWEDTVKGLKLSDGTYFVATQENLKKLRPEKSDTIDIIEFVDTANVSPLYYDRHYYVGPQKANDKSFFLFAQALTVIGQAAIGQFVLRDKEYVCLLQPYQSALLMTTLNYEYEIKRVDAIEELKPPAKLVPEELKLAELLMSKLYKKQFDISHFKDSFAERLNEAIKLHEEGKIVPIAKVAPAEKPRASLMDALKASLSQYEKAPARGAQRLAQKTPARASRATAEKAPIARASSARETTSHKSRTSKAKSTARTSRKTTPTKRTSSHVNGAATAPRKSSKHENGATTRRSR